MGTADDYLRRGGECAAAAWAEDDAVDARLLRAFATEFLARADELERAEPGNRLLRRIVSKEEETR